MTARAQQIDDFSWYAEKTGLGDLGGLPLPVLLWTDAPSIDYLGLSAAVKVLCWKK